MAQRVQTFQDAFNSVQKQLNDINQQLPVQSSQAQMIVEATAIEDDAVCNDTETIVGFPNTATGTAAGQYSTVSSNVVLNSFYFQQWGWGLLTWT